MNKVMVIYGTRPEAIKVAPIIHQLKQSTMLVPIVVTTGQHQSMLEQVNTLFNISPDYDLQVFNAGQSLNQLSAKIFNRLDPILQQEKPDAILVQGDTTTVAMAAIAAFYSKIPVVHLEAGLRSGDTHNPFPEEANRRISTVVADLHLAPTTVSRDNLRKEGISDSAIVVTGNTVIDALFHVLEMGSDSPISDPVVDELISCGKPYVLATCHRRENWGENMQKIGLALHQIAQKLPHWNIVFAAHSNPLVRETILPCIGQDSNVYLCDAMPYADFAKAMAHSTLVLTDSGGLQEEAPSLGKPVLVMRDNTERPEGIMAGTVKLVGTDPKRIVDEVLQLATNDDDYQAMAQAKNPFGDGHAAEACVVAIEKMLKGTQGSEK